LFIKPDVLSDAEELKKLIVFEKPYDEEMRTWLTGSKGFSENKVNSGLEKLTKAQTKKNQIRLDSFFKKSAVISSSKKVEAPKKSAPGKKGAKKSVGTKA
jgi:flap endonuclease-1